jgi:hypothetical protein
MQGKLLSELIINGTPMPAPTGFVQNGDLGTGISWIITALGVVAVLAALFFLLWGGIKWITSGGDKEKVDGARKTVIYAIIGLIVVILSVLIINTVSDLFFGSNTPTSSSVKPYDCPDKSNKYFCDYTSDTHCARCSPDPSCHTDIKSILECTHSTARCDVHVADSCPAADSPPGKSCFSYCNALPGQDLGTCEVNCSDTDPNQPNQ